MANIDLDTAIRKLMKQQHKSLMAVVNNHKDRYAALATKAKDADTRQRHRQLAKDAFEIGAASVKRLQMSADNIADSYARAMRQVTEASADLKSPPVAKKAPPPEKRASKKTKKAVRKG